jgi:hypothetical protein
MISGYCTTRVTFQIGVGGELSPPPAPDFFQGCTSAEFSVLNNCEQSVEGHSCPRQHFLCIERLISPDMTSSPGDSVRFSDRFLAQ